MIRANLLDRDVFVKYFRPKVDYRSCPLLDAEEDGHATRPKIPIEVMLRACAKVDNGVLVAVVCRKVGMVEETFYRYREKNAGMKATEARKGAAAALVLEPMPLNAPYSNSVSGFVSALSDTEQRLDAKSEARAAPDLAHAEQHARDER